MSEILVVDDERIVRDSLKGILEAEGYSVRLARNGEDALAKFRAARPDLVLLDVMMTGRNGFSVCEEMRAEDAALPIIFLTGMDGELQEVKGMTVGGDDYILKTAPREVMLARIRRSLARRIAPAAPSGSLRVGRALVDFTSRCAVFDDGGTERLTGSELDILRALASDRSRYFTIREICEKVHGENHATEPATLRSQISRLKLKLGTSGDLIHSERFTGYRLLP